MRYLTVLLFGLLFLTTTTDLSAQDSLVRTAAYPEGLSLEYGMGSYAYTDEYISSEKYSGSMPYYRIGFSNRHESYVYQIGIEFRSATDIRNYNVTAEVTEFSLNQGFLYPLPGFFLFSREAYAYIGPSTEIFVYANRQNIAVSGFDYAQSYAALLSLGLRSELFCPLSSRFTIESSLNVGVLSLGFRMVDMEETDESPVKPLTIFSAVNGSLRLGIRYYPAAILSVKASYVLAVTRILPWDPLHVASDNLVVTVTYGL